MAGISSKAMGRLDNKYEYNGKEKQAKGQEAHRQEQAKLRNEGAETEVTMTLEDVSTVRKDGVRPDGTTVIIKPNTKTGKAAARRKKNAI